MGAAASAAEPPPNISDGDEGEGNGLIDTRLYHAFDVRSRDGAVALGATGSVFGEATVEADFTPGVPLAARPDYNHLPDLLRRGARVKVLEFCGDNVVIQDGTGRLGMAQLSLLQLHRSAAHRTVYEAMRRNGLEVTDGAHLGADFMCAASDGARQSFAVRVVRPNEALSGVAALSSLFGDLSLPMMYASVDADSGAISCVLLNFNPQLSYNSRLGFERLLAQVIQADAAISLDTVADGGLANADDTSGSESVGESSLASVQGGVLRVVLLLHQHAVDATRFHDVRAGGGVAAALLRDGGGSYLCGNH